MSNLENKSTSYLIGRIKGLTQLLKEQENPRIVKIANEIDKVVEILFQRELEKTS